MPEDPGATWRFQGVSRRPTLNVQRPPTTKRLWAAPALANTNCHVYVYARDENPFHSGIEGPPCEGKGSAPAFYFFFVLSPPLSLSADHCHSHCRRLVWTNGRYCAMPFAKACLNPQLQSHVNITRAAQSNAAGFAWCLSGMRPRGECGVSPRSQLPSADRELLRLGKNKMKKAKTKRPKNKQKSAGRHTHKAPS